MDATEFRTLDGSLELECPLVHRNFQVWELPKRKARVGKARHEWRLGVRLEVSASGERPQRIFDLPSTHPGIRRADFREVMDVPRNKGRLGYSPGAATDARLGPLVMAYQ